MEAIELRGLLEEQLRLSRRLRAKIRDLEQDRAAPLAIVGVAMRFPGRVTTPGEYWELLTSDRDLISEIPAERPGLGSAYQPGGGPGRSYVNRAGFLSEVAEFDAEFFGISQREAVSLDPQQRLLLETSWEAFERAGVAVRRSESLDAGVFIGLMAAEYAERLADGPAEALDPYYGTGSGHCFAAGRISYALGLRGPAVSIDTACSSSLVALHAATRSLRARECRYALVGGANLLFSPRLMVALCQSRALAPDGRCKPFLAAADGYGRGEGVAAIVVMRLDDALEQDRPVLAVLRGIAVNHDGASAGLTVPNGPAQQAVIRAALDDAGVSPAEVSYVEAHGTGTALGDPIEAAALDAVFGDGHDRSGTRLLVSSVKARLGHLEAASGMAGLIKLVLMLRHGMVPADITTADAPLSNVIPWRQLRLEVPRQSRSWTDGSRTAGISAFGMSGTNAHAVLAAPPGPAATAAEPPATAARGSRPELLVLSARTEAALRELTAAVIRLLSVTAPGDLPSVCHTLRAGRAPLMYRVAVVGATPRELADALSAASGTASRMLPSAAERTAVLGVRPATRQTLARSVAVLASELPLLATGDGTSDPAAWLSSALGALGLAIRPAKDADADGSGYAAGLCYAGRWVNLVPEDPRRATAGFLEALGSLYAAGADLRMTPLRVPGARFFPDVPTYPFQRKRYWIDEPFPGGLADTASAGPPADRRSQAHSGGVEEIERFLAAELHAALRADDELDLTLSFAELGGDSFTVMLFAKSIEDQYDIDDIAEVFIADHPAAHLLRELAHHIAGRIAEQVPQAGSAP